MSSDDASSLRNFGSEASSAARLYGRHDNALRLKQDCGRMFEGRWRRRLRASDVRAIGRDVMVSVLPSG